MNNNFWIYLLVMFGVTYLIRVLPLALIRHQIKNKYIRSFLHYIPYTVLCAMTFPAVFYSVENPIAAIAGVVCALILAFLNKSLCTVAAAASATVYVVGIIVNYF